MASQTVTRSSESNRRQLSRIRQNRFDCSAFDGRQQLTPARQGQVVDCIIMHPRKSRVTIVLQRDNQTHTMLDRDSIRNTDILIGHLKFDSGLTNQRRNQNKAMDLSRGSAAL